MRFGRDGRKLKSRRGRIVDPAYKAWIATLPCFICQAHNVEVAHFGTHGMAQKANDSTCLPTCIRHHREGPASFHKLTGRYWEYHGLDRDTVIAHYQAMYATQKQKKAA